MDEVDGYICEAVREWVCSGFHAREALQKRLIDMVQNEGMRKHAARYLNLLDMEFESRQVLGCQWPELTDYGQQLYDRDKHEYFGYCFYLGPDVVSALSGSGLYFTFGDLEGISARKNRVARRVIQELHTVGLIPEWDGNTQCRLCIPGFEWQKRLTVL